ncbi:flavin-containing monooxygenase [Pseudomonas panipatensis]|uniref:Predicted flavoprotein CzcO associated with the cation diffusion facilitator CzcD n=1 Tax=Pseudomonas panipatensis TaxID=428992 RepID=A0A1G8F6V1_9PSED|nr:NAD(P)/FAD-dependent oxidoreductase [Pseudomonas panipatensis]SDH77913.1 Predicted flavoprotein CzcO associated with the cation diffusion facilitator CzcD [Pseudomonas panipatensis]SMP55134.1 Predicted flavoprotein CzcO associated with the cation diffusion facilitator CzcD [Pseudomonas panipatensis]
MHNTSRDPSPLRVLIIGAGFAGIGLAIRLQQAGVHDYLILEKAADVGGVWRENSYPGAACDVPSHLYSFSFEPKADWTRKFAPQAEILDYLRHCADKYGLRQRIRFACEAVDARFVEAEGEWLVQCADGEVLRTRALVCATGQLSRPLYPRIPGLDGFRGAAFHSAHWDRRVDLRGKRVAVIGTGASAIQFVPQIAPQVEQLLLFQRSAAYVIGKPDRAYAAWERRLKAHLPWLQRLDRGLKYLQHESRVLAFATFPVLMTFMQRGFRRHLRRSIGDPQLRQRLTPDYPLGCKRILISNDYYPALARDNVRLIDEGIREVSEDAIVTRDGQRHAVDAIIFGTGFAATEFLAPLRIQGLAGRWLEQAWAQGAEAYKGISVSGFPNLFILYGPNTNLGHSSIVYMLESQYPYVLACLQRLREHGLRYLDVKPEVQRAYNQKLQHALQHTVWERGCDSWYKTAEGRNTNNWPGFTFVYRQQTRHPEFADYECAR